MNYLALIPLLVSLSNYCHADFVAKVVGVTDGDTITVLDAQKIR